MIRLKFPSKARAFLTTRQRSANHPSRKQCSLAEVFSPNGISQRGGDKRKKMSQEEKKAKPKKSKAPLKTETDENSTAETYVTPDENPDGKPKAKKTKPKKAPMKTETDDNSIAETDKENTESKAKKTKPKKSKAPLKTETVNNEAAAADEPPSDTKPEPENTDNLAAPVTHHPHSHSPQPLSARSRSTRASVESNESVKGLRLHREADNLEPVSELKETGSNQDLVRERESEKRLAHRKDSKPEQNITKLLARPSPEDVRDLKTYANQGHLVIADRWILGRKIGAGTFGKIYLGLTPSEETVALKFIPDGKHSDNQLKIEYRFYTILRSCKDFPKVYYIGALAGYQVLAMELLGPSLNDVFNAMDGKLPLNYACNAGVQCLVHIQVCGRLTEIIPHHLPPSKCTKAASSTAM